MKNCFHSANHSIRQTHTQSHKRSRIRISRRSWRLMHGGCPNTKKHKKRSRRRIRMSKRCAGEGNTFRHSHYGFEWNMQSCWMDASLMALFYPDSLYSIVSTFFLQNNNKQIADVKNTLVKCISEMRSPTSIPSLHGLRSILARHIRTLDQKYAFQLENELGYVFYFLQELLKMFDVKCMRARPPDGENFKKLYVMEMEHCNNITVEQCLQKKYKKWIFHSELAHYMIIELIDEDGKYSVKPQETISFLKHKWSLCSMIVFDCSHFISYIKQDGKWFLYDDTRSLSHKELDPYAFGSFYRNGHCHFKYGKNNTFFFYTRLRAL